MKKKKPTRSDRRQKELRRLAPWLFLFEAFAAAKATAGAPETSLSHTGKKVSFALQNDTFIFECF